MSIKANLNNAFYDFHMVSEITYKESTREQRSQTVQSDLQNLINLPKKKKNKIIFNS